MSRSTPTHARPSRHRAPVPVGPSGVFTRPEAHACGWTDSALAHALVAGRLVRVKRGVFAYRADDAADPPAQPQAEAALLRLARATSRICARAAVSHCPAAIATGLALLERPDRPCLTVPAGTALRELAQAHLHRASLPAHHVTMLDGCLTTTVARTVLDIAREHGYLAGVVAADAALHNGLVTRAELGEVVEFCRHWPGRRSAERVVDLCDGLAESPLESISRVRMVQSGLPTPVAQAEIGDEFGRFIARVDFYWPRFGVIGQSDGAEKYRFATSLISSERRADAALRDLGLLVVRWDWYDAFHFVPIAQRLRDSFARGVPARRGRWSVLNSPRVRATRSA